MLSNPQSYLNGFVGGLLFMPTAVGFLIWGVPLLRSLGAEPAEAVHRASSIAFGWVIGAPLFGYIADRIGLRKPVLLVGIVLMLMSLYGIVYIPGVLPHYSAGLAFGLASGAAMIPYTMIKEANRIT